MSHSGVAMQASRAPRGSSAVGHQIMAPPPQDTITVGQFSDEAVDKLIARYRGAGRRDGGAPPLPLPGMADVGGNADGLHHVRGGAEPSRRRLAGGRRRQGLRRGLPGPPRQIGLALLRVLLLATATAFASSLCIILLLAITKLFSATNIMAFNLLVAVDMISLAVAFVAGSSSNRNMVFAECPRVCRV
ncbi:hypothetical protein GUJ93_ZPchr0023g33396 [Zizania palustris]|uniref:PGG domain-containing protein n=1 Tax=Zizania palustris TaxID=103762 RepID=A0A8J5QVR1_ZIZPA|nr:hypothetical protein GUJ93_ZPchr0023g33396 [Zizania palustris]